MKEEYRKRLLATSRDCLVKSIDSKSSGLITDLMSRGVFSDYDEQRVTGVQPDTNDDRNELILNLIARKSQSDFFNFIWTLNHTGQLHVVVSLIGAPVVANIMTLYESGADAEHTYDVDAELVECMREMFQTDGDVVQKVNEFLSHIDTVVTAVGKGSVRVTFTCESVESLQHFRGLYNNIEKMLNEAVCSQFARKGLKSLKLVISNEQFEQCANTFVRSVPMTSRHRDALTSSEEFLIDKMTVSGDLLDRLSLCNRRRQAIEQAATHEQQVKILLDIVSRQPDAAFTQLLNALRDTGQHESAFTIQYSTPTSGILINQEIKRLLQSESSRQQAGDFLCSCQ